VIAFGDRPSPNHDARRHGIDMMVLHYTGMTGAAAALRRLTDPLSKVSAHYLVEEDGQIWRLVPEERRAWHAGVSFWAGERDVNGLSIGIELANPGHEFGYRLFPDPQMRALEALALDILARHPIPRDRVLGHSDVAPARKQDPGELFDWERLARAGIGCWPGETPSEIPLEIPSKIPLALNRGDLLAELARYGYDVGDGPAAIAAFQRHFRPGRIDGIGDPETCARLAGLVHMLKSGRDRH
jgi:N-acetylmuramoyl-L-alanine amidase